MNTMNYLRAATHKLQEPVDSRITVPLALRLGLGSRRRRDFANQSRRHVAAWALALGLLVGAGSAQGQLTAAWVWVSGSGNWTNSVSNGWWSCTSTDATGNSICSNNYPGYYVGDTIKNYDSALFTNPGAAYTVKLTAPPDPDNPQFFVRQCLFQPQDSNTAATVTLEIPGTLQVNVDAQGRGLVVAEKAGSTATVYIASATNYFMTPYFEGNAGLVVGGQAVIGRHGVGTLYVTNGLVEAGNSDPGTILGSETNGQGTLVISGPNTYWANGRQMSVGNTPASWGNKLVVSNSASLYVGSALTIGSGPTDGGSSNNTVILDHGSIFGGQGDEGEPIVLGHRSTSPFPSYNNTVLIKNGGTWNNRPTTLFGSFTIGFETRGGGCSNCLGDPYPTWLATGNVVRIYTGGLVTNVSVALVTASNTLDMLGGVFEQTSDTTNQGVIQGFGTLDGTICVTNEDHAVNNGSGLIYTSHVWGLLAVSNSVSGGVTNTLTILHGLILYTNSVTQRGLGTNYAPLVVSLSSGSNDFLRVGGTLNITDSGGFSTGVYHLIEYGTNGPGFIAATNVTYYSNGSGWQIGSVPNTNYTYIIDTSTVGQVNLIVSYGPGITSQPQNSVVYCGDPASFSVVGCGMPPLAYQWQKNTNNLTDVGNISGSTTCMLTLNPTTTTDAGNYRVIIANAYGSVTSSFATLTVDYVPNICEHIPNGLAWLVSQQNTNGSWGGSAGYTPVGYTGFAVLKLEERAFELGYASPFDDAYLYKTNVINGLNYLFSQAATYGTNTGICFAKGGGESETYGTGIAMMSIAASRAPDSIVNVPGSIVNGMTFKAVLQSNVAYFAWSQNADGGWRYEAGEGGSDNSNSGYAVLGLRYAEAPIYGFACTIPAALKVGLNNWINAIQVSGGADDGGSDYTVGRGWVNLLKTGNLLSEMSFVGDNTSVPRVQRAIAYIQRHWNDNNDDPGWRPHNYQAMQCLAEGFRSLGIETITVGGSDVDWFVEFANAILASQQTNGSWPADSYGDAMLSTEWALFVLEKCNTALAITCPANIVVPNAPGQCSSNVTFAITATGCPAPAVVCMIGSNVITSPYAFPVGTTTVNCTASNGCGIATCSFTVTVNDTQPPSANCPANIVSNNAPGQGGAVVNFTLPSNTDNCGVASAVATPPSGSFFPVGTNTVAVVVTDIHGNTNSCGFTVTVNDTQPPVIQCPTNLIVTVPSEMSCACDVELGSPQVSDNCGVASVVSNAPNCFPVGTNFVVWTATDASRNAGTCTQQVVVVQVPVDSSNFRILGIGVIHNDVRLSWQTFGYTTNVVQLATPTIGGSYTNSFNDIGAVFVPGSGLVITNWVDYGGATNHPSRFYRIRLEPGSPPCQY